STAVTLPFTSYSFSPPPPSFLPDEQPAIAAASSAASIRKRIGFMGHLLRESVAVVLVPFLRCPGLQLLHLGERPVRVLDSVLLAVLAAEENRLALDQHLRRHTHGRMPQTFLRDGAILLLRRQEPVFT